MEIAYYTMDDKQLNATCNNVKEHVIGCLKSEGLLPSDCDWANTHGVLIHGRGWFGSWMDKWLFKPEDKLPRISVIKVVN